MSHLHRSAGEAMARSATYAKQARADIEAHFPQGAVVHVDPQEDGAFITVALGTEHLFAAITRGGTVERFLRTGSTERDDEEEMTDGDASV